MFGSKKLTAQDLKAAVDPNLMRQLSSECQHPVVAGKIADETAAHYGAKKNWFTGTRDKKAVVKEFEQILSTEIAKVQICKSRIAVLAQEHSEGKLKPGDTEIVEPASYGALAGDDDVTLAAKWIAKSSNTMKGDGSDEIKRIIQAEMVSKSALTIDTVDRLWRALVPNPNPTVRHINENGAAPLLCDKLGHVKMENAIAMKLGADDSIGKALYLMAVIIRTHGYPDGNGRIARVVYAISMLRGLEPLPPGPPAKTAWVQEGHGRYKKVGQGAAAPANRFVAPTPPFATSLVRM